ncbi:hypothetical protein [Thalassospira xiamenensis]|jgi:hypothetical protein|uniref:hypothetical protein n=1 Tax=Thalassospira xiamenensis TaxID=220697 RepID=UPI000DED8AF1|nr:hypothetical protein [Thalassospira xiamenensis]RCK34587.1 hypothetical protein TH24_20545 [Thalassospira xiamenensis]
MARAWELSPNIVAFNFDKPEETILIHHLNLALKYAPNDEKLANFTEKFFEKGLGVSETDFRHIIQLAQKNCPATLGLKLTPTAKSAYIENRDVGKAASRQMLREQLMGPKGQDILAAAYADLERLEPISENDWLQQKHLFERFEKGPGQAHPNDVKSSLTNQERQRRMKVLADSLQTVGASRSNSQSEPPGMGDQPDMAGVDLLAHMHSDRLSEEGVPEPAIKMQKAKPTSSELLTDIHKEIRQTNALLVKLIEAIENGNKNCNLREL